MVVQLLVFLKSHSFANKNHCNVIFVLENNYITLLLFCNNITNKSKTVIFDILSKLCDIHCFFLDVPLYRPKVVDLKTSIAKTLEKNDELIKRPM